MRYPKLEIGVRVHYVRDIHRTGIIEALNPNAGTIIPGYWDVEVRWDDNTLTREMLWSLTDIEKKRRAAERAAKRWS